MKNVIVLVGLLFITYLAAGLGAFGMGDFIPWYSELNKPFFNPPNWIFGPVWSFLYTAMAVAAFLVYKKGLNTKGVKVALFLYFIQLILNTLWSPMFFGWHLLGGALIIILLLLFTIILMYLNFKRINKWAGYLILPYIAWVSFATLLNASIWWLN